MQEIARICEHEQMMLKGGYTVSEAEDMMNNGRWTGGQVDGLGYVGSGVTVYGCYNINDHLNKCCQCPTGSEFATEMTTEDDPLRAILYMAGVYLNHWIDH